MRTPQRAVAAVLLLLATGPLPAARPTRLDPGSEALLALLEVERRGRADDVAELERIGILLGRAESAAAGARSRALDGARGAEGDVAGLRDEEDRVGETEGRLRALQDARRAVASRLLDRVRRIATIQEELSRRKVARSPSDPLSGRWEIVVNPGTRKGVMRLTLDGTLVTGDYTLDGGFRGSVRGTFVAEKVTLQRIDAERGLDAYFYGRLAPDRKRITGTWEATALAPATGPVAGSWVASSLPDTDDSDGGNP